MRPFLVIGFGLGLVLTRCAGPLGAATAADPAELIVRFDSGATAADRRDAREEARTGFERRLPVQGMQLVEVDPGQSAAAAERALDGADGVLYAEPNVIRSAFPRPGDPYFSQLWAMENTGQSIRGTPGTPDADADVAEAWDAGVVGGTVVAVVDTGGDAAHPDLSPKLLPGHDFVANDDEPSDENGHGTHVAGTIAADGGNGIGVVGVADNAAKVMPLRVLDGNGSGTVSNVILAYGYAAQHGAKVVNLSLGASSSSRAERDAIAAFPSMLFVAAAGNGGADGAGDDNDAMGTYPCAYLLPNVVCVAASDNRDQLAGFSNYGASSVDLAAPGVSIASTWLGGGYSWSSGTSMAAPHGSGAAALLWAAAPGAQPTDISSSLLGGVDALPAFTGRTVSGGRLNVLRSLRLVADVGVGAPAPAPEPGGSSEARTLRFPRWHGFVAGASRRRRRRATKALDPHAAPRAPRPAARARAPGAGALLRALHGAPGDAARAQGSHRPRQRAAASGDRQTREAPSDARRPPPARASRVADGRARGPRARRRPQQSHAEPASAPGC